MYIASPRRHAPLSLSWWLRVLLAGLSLGAAVSIKLVSLSTVALLGLVVARDLWLVLGDRTVPIARILKTAAALLAALVAVPLAVYVGSFAVHFAVLTRSGPGDAFMTPTFQVCRLRAGCVRVYVRACVRACVLVCFYACLYRNYTYISICMHVWARVEV
jgi:dolichyl-phosphate-mannose--protein O-mannosyl transferase